MKTSVSVRGLFILNLLNMKIKAMLPMMMIASVPLVSMAQGQAGIRETNLDKSVRPADDFYQFATGGWQKNNPLPAAFSRFGSFDQLQEDNNKRINTILTELLKKKTKQGTIEQKLGDFYKLAMDSVRRNKEGVSPLMPLINEMEGAKTLAFEQSKPSMSSMAMVSRWVTASMLMRRMLR